MAVPSQFSTGHFQIPAPHLGRHRVLLDKGLLCKVDLERIVRRQGHAEASGKECGHGVAMVVEEERVVAEGAHAKPHLT